MSNEKFTSGEWLATNRQLNNKPYIAITSGDKVITETLGRRCDEIANAQLIAQAPAMYRMLKNLVDSEAIRGEYSAMDIEAQLLLAKARGEL